MPAPIALLSSQPIATKGPEPPEATAGFARVRPSVRLTGNSLDWPFTLLNRNPAEPPSMRPRTWLVPTSSQATTYDPPAADVLAIDGVIWSPSFTTSFTEVACSPAIFAPFVS